MVHGVVPRALALKILTNYLDHLAGVEVDDIYKAEVR